MPQPTALRGVRARGSCSGQRREGTAPKLLEPCAREVFSTAAVPRRKEGLHRLDQGLGERAGVAMSMAEP